MVVALPLLIFILIVQKLLPPIFKKRGRILEYKTWGLNQWSLCSVVNLSSVYSGLSIILLGSRDSSTGTSMQYLDLADFETATKCVKCVQAKWEPDT